LQLDRSVAADEETLMKPIATMMAACTVPFLWTVSAQQEPAASDAALEQTREGIPASPHQEEALRDIGGELFSRLDENGDASISVQEARAEAALAERWDELDRNGNQTLDETEFAAYERSTASEESAQDSADVQVAEGELTEEGLPASPHQQDVTQSDLIEQLDTDGDGAVSRQEAQADARLQSEWQELDQDQDGELDRIELSQLEHE
jgi:hypothetical protein